MGITNANKQIDTDRIECDGTLKVTLALTAVPDISSNPTDIVLILDRSGSMKGQPLENLKLGADLFIDIIDEATDSAKDGHIGAGSHIGIVSFDGTAKAETGLITSVEDLKKAVDGLSADGLTNHGEAFTSAVNLFDQASPNAKVIVMFTDGVTTAGPPPSPIAESARGAGITIFVIGLAGQDGVDVSALNDWATDPDSSHVAVTPDAQDLTELFANLARNISKPGATDIVIEDVIHQDFVITGVVPPTKGTAVMQGNNKIQWKIEELGVTGSEGATLMFFIRHIGDDSGLKHVNASIHYSDVEHNAVNFPDPEVEVDCGITIRPEPCPVAKPIEIAGCQDAVEVDLGNVFLESTGCILEVDVTLKNVCPNKKEALAVLLTEIDIHGEEHRRGLKTITIPAHHEQRCRDVKVKCIKFILPESLDVSGDLTAGGECRERHFKARAFAHYIDTAFDCCGEIHGITSVSTAGCQCACRK